MLSDLAWLWAVSKLACGGTGIRALRGRVVFMRQAIRRLESLRSFIHPEPGTALQRLMAKRPETVGAIMWPYQCTSWNAGTRLAKIAEHFDVIQAMGSKLDFPVEEALELLDLSDLFPHLHVVLDQPRWFLREGQLVVNLFLRDVRVFSLAFSFARDAGRIVACVGAIQGGNVDGLLVEYREMTKAMQGMRPRDLLVELFRAFCRAVGVSQMLAVADASRQHRSGYFGKTKAETLSLNYDEIWLERGGVAKDDDFFELPVTLQLKDLEEVPSKKRGMYRRRNELLRDLDGRMHEACFDLRVRGERLQ